MRLSATIIAFLTAGLTPAAGLSLFGGDQEVIGNENLKIPGESPLELCDKSHENDLIQIESVDMSPNPPEAGKELVITARAIVHETIDEGAYINLQVKYGLIRLISTKADLCDSIKNVDLDCPIEKGLVAITKSVDLPKEIPPGKYTVLADVYTKDDDSVTCLTAQVVFGKKDKTVAFLDL